MKEKGIKILFSIFLFASILMPFSVFADDYTSSTVVGYDVSYVDTVFDNVQNKPNYIYEVRITLDDSYVGYINISGTVSYNDGTAKTLTLSSTNRFVNGNQIVFRFYIIGVRYADAEYRPSLSSVQLTYGNHSLTKHSDIQSLDEIINILNDLYNNTDGIEGLLSNQLTQLQDIVINTSNLTSYLDILTKLRQWNFPVESLSTIGDHIFYNVPVVDFYSNSYWTYPIFNFPTNTLFVRKWHDVNNTNYFNLVLIKEGNLTRNNISTYYTFEHCSYDTITELMYSPTYSIYLIKVIPELSYEGFSIVRTASAFKTTALWFNPATVKNISTDFALNFGLTNQLLDDLHIIAQGTQQSNSAASGLDQNTNQMQSDFNSYYSIENSANSDFNSALNGINFNDQIAGNQSFLDSASFVKTVFSSMMQIPILSTFVIILCIVLMARIFL